MLCFSKKRKLEGTPRKGWFAGWKDQRFGPGEEREKCLLSLPLLRLKARKGRWLIRGRLGGPKTTGLWKTPGLWKREIRALHC